MFDDNYANVTKRNIKQLAPTTGLIDTLTALLLSFNNVSRDNIKGLIMPF